MKNLRRTYRVDPRALQLRGLLRHKSGRVFEPEVLDLSACGMRLWLRDDVPPPRVGATLPLGLQSLHLAEPIRTLATVVRVEQREHAVELGLEIRDWLNLRATVPEALQSVFNVRAGRRHRLDPGCPVHVARDDVWTPGEADGLLHDISEGGAAFSLDPEHELAQAEARQVRLTFTLPDDEQPFALRAEVVRLEDDGERPRFGVCFTPGDSVDERRQCLMLGKWVQQRHYWAATRRVTGGRHRVL